MSRENLAEPPRGAREVIKVHRVKVMDRQEAQTFGIIGGAAGDEAEETSLGLFVKLVAIIVFGIMLAWLVSQLIDI